MRNRLLLFPVASGAPALLLLILSSLLLLRWGAAPALGKGGAEAIVVSPDGSRLYVARGAIQSYSSTNAVSVIETARLTLAATLQPVSVPGVSAAWRNDLLCSLAVSPDGSQLFVGRGGAIDILNPATDRWLGTAKAGPLPISMAVSPDGRRLYAPANAGVMVIDSASGKPLSTLRLLSETRYLFLSPDGHRLTAIGPSSLQMIDADTLQVIRTVWPGRNIDGAALSPDGQRLYLTTRPIMLTPWESRLDVYDTDTLQMITSATLSSGKYVFGAKPMVSSDGQRIYVTLYNSTDLVRVLDAATLKVTGALPMGDLKPGGGGLVALSPDGKTLYIASPAGDTVRAVDTASFQVKATLDLGSMPTP